jgi:hypothetical protein
MLGACTSVFLVASGELMEDLTVISIWSRLILNNRSNPVLPVSN